MKKFIIWIILLIFLSIIPGIILSPYKIDVVFNTIENKSISKEFDDYTILFFSDLLLKDSSDIEYLESAVNKINNLYPDIVIFGGDLFYNADIFQFNEEQLDKINTLLESINPKYSKYYVFGDNDLSSDNTMNITSTIMDEANFECIENELITVNINKESINLVGLPNNINGTINDEIIDNLNNSYNIVVSHTPDTINDYNISNIDYFIAGHTLGGQVYLPIIGSLVNIKSEFINGTHQISDTTISISNGLGSITNHKYRFLANKQIVLYTIKTTY